MLFFDVDNFLFMKENRKYSFYRTGLYFSNMLGFKLFLFITGETSLELLLVILAGCRIVKRDLV